MQNYKARVNSLETFGLVDGPGVRFVIFLQGCNMRCMYCHNPETWAMRNDETEEYSAQELFDKAYRYKNYWGKNSKEGGITVSGGEPLLQIDFLIELFTLAKSKGVHTCVDTAGQPFSMEKEFLEKFNKLMSVTDLFIVDIKMFDCEKHKKLTAFENDNIKDMMRYLSKNGKDMWIRRVLVPNLTDEEEDLRKTNEFIESLETVQRVEVLPYHSLGMVKWNKLGINYALKDTKSPTEKEVLVAEKILNVEKYRK